MVAEAPERKAWRQARSAAELAQVLVWLLALAGALTGAGLIMSTREKDTLLGSDEHPYIAHGIGVIIAAIAVSVVLHAVLAYVLWRLEREAPSSP